MKSIATGIVTGFGQVFFASRLLPGALIALALFIGDWRSGLLGLLGAVSQTLFTRVLLRRNDIDCFNGVLIGAILGCYHGVTLISLALTLAIAAMQTPLTLVLMRLFPSWLPVSTAPFCISGTLIYFFYPAVRPAGDVLTSWWSAPIGGFAEVMLIDGIIPGLLIIAALLIESRRLGLVGVLGALVAVAVSFLPFIQMSSLSIYCAVLAAMALRHRILFAVLAAAVSVPIHEVLTPALTWPFLISMWIFLIADRFIPSKASKE